MKHLLTFFLLFNLSFVYGQDAKKSDNQLRAAIHGIKRWSSYSGEHSNVNAYDSLDKANEVFAALLLQVTASNNSTLSYDFKALQDSGLRIATSEDKLFRIYSWDTETGGTMHYFRNVFQYKAGNAVLSKAGQSGMGEGDAGCFYTAINDVSVDNKRFYITQNIAVYSSGLSYHTVKIFSIDNGVLNDTAKLIKTKTGIRNQLGYEVDMTASANRDADIPDYHIKYDKATKTISIPLIQENGKVTHKRILYRFTGKYFEKVQ